ncbi:DUF4132 domain-containing protein [Streptomyces griseosporeus]|uniref:DUF4132 domain-containing protein n=1 Tax=Streptomyces griseosporeus TaxID=1910 RepID=UPI0037900F30
MRGGASTGEQRADGQAVVLPDEDTFRMPEAWRRLVLPRRDGIERPVPPLHPEAEAVEARRVKEEAGWIEAMLTAPKSHPRLVQATRDHLNGSQNPLGAAALGHLIFHYRHPDGIFVDAWVRAHGLPFAARAVVDFFGVEPHYIQYGSRRDDPWLGFLPGNGVGTGWARTKFADRMRALLAVAGEDDYRRAVEALAACRTDVRRRVVVSYLVPGERAWAEECCAEADGADGSLRAMLLCSLGSPDQLRHFGDRAGLGWDGWSPVLIATLAESTGAAFARFLEEPLDRAYNSDVTRTYASALVELPSDEAFRILLDRSAGKVAGKHIRPHLLEAMRRYPVRALRLLGAAATGAGKNASLAGQLLTSHVAAHPEVAEAALPGLPARVAAFVAPLLTRAGRVPDAPAEALPALLVSPPWTRKRKAVKPRVAAEVPVAPEPAIAWRPGERESWAKAGAGYAAWRDGGDWSRQIDHLRRTGELESWWHVRLFVDGPEDVVRPLLADCDPEDYWDGEEQLKPVAARHGLAALPLMRRAATRHPSTLGRLLLPYRSAEVAELVCDWLARLKAADATARAWLTRHGLDAVPFLAPHAVGPAGPVRRGAEKALRLLADAHGVEAVVAGVAGREPGTAAVAGGGVEAAGGAGGRAEATGSAGGGSEAMAVNGGPEAAGSAGDGPEAAGIAGGGSEAAYLAGGGAEGTAVTGGGVNTTGMAGSGPNSAGGAGGRAEAVGIVAAMLAVDPLVSALPARVPAVVPWAEPALLPQILLAGGGALPAEAVRHVLTVLALSKPGDVYPGLEVLTAHCTADSLAAFAWGLFEQWRLVGMPPKESWALHALGWLGDDDTVRRLTPVLRAWPGEGAHHRAVEGLAVLAEIGTEVALTHLHGISQRVPFKALKQRAREKIAEVAEGLGLTGEQLGDRLVPDLGLDADGSTVIDYGPRQFTVGFDEQLRPCVRDADGRQRKALPAPGAKDDPELAPAERKRFAALKKDVRAVGAEQVRRLEAAMVAQRSWTVREFQELFVAHPLVGHLVRRLVWLAEGGGVVTAFRVTEDRTFAGADDGELTLPEDVRVRVAHPLHLGGDLPAWSAVFAGQGILQPFPQLGRPVHRLTGEEAAGHRLTRFEGASVPVGKLLGLTRRGWERGEPQDAGVERWFHRRVDDDRHVVIGLDEGIAVGALDVFPDQTFAQVWLDSAPGDYWPSRGYPLRFGDLDPVVASEILADLTEVTAG